MSDSKQTILVVEDESGIRELVSEVLRRRGYQVLAARDGAEAVELAEGHGDGIHLVLTDLIMPGLSGVELADALRGIWPSVKVLLMSGYGSAAIEELTEQTDSELLEKPFTPTKLVERVQRLLESPVAG